MAVHTTLSDSIRRQRSADEQMPVVQEGASRHGADGHANHLAAMMWEWRRPDEMALSRKPLSNGSKTGLLERQFDRVINHAPCCTGVLTQPLIVPPSCARFTSAARFFWSKLA